ncbi:unnamed protein product [Pocillopora meandrina]|uniref:Uncharacterized protein n=1 Tax=Pocillopora meandrina TaxID=46732 RepID=A0AAU9WFQ1_9CNID|nr:unnamed protein product [Pocillopora meandrina]
MPLDLPLYYAGVADEDMLDEFLVGRRELDHGQSSTMDVRRFLNVKYHQASVGKMKKVAAVSTIAIIFFIVIIFTFGSPPVKKIAMKTSSAQSPTSEESGTKQHFFVLATNPDIPVKLSLNCHTCSLVSSSGMLLGSNAGSEIDSADCVFRLNSAPTLGYERDVGRRTTVRVVSVTGFKSLIRDSWQETLASFEDLDYMILLGPDEALCKNCTLSKLYQKFAKYLKNTGVLRVTQETYQKVTQESRNLGIKYGRQDLPISTRYFTMNLVRQFCPRIRVFGMELENPCERHGTVPVFYWLPDSWQSNCLSQGERVHQQFLKGLVRLRQERQIFKSWAHKYHIEFFYPSHIVT